MGPLTADCELLTEQLVVVFAGDLEKAENGVSVDAQADHAAAAVDFFDGIGWHQAATAREEPGADGQRVGHVRLGSEHRTLNPADHAAL